MTPGGRIWQGGEFWQRRQAVPAWTLHRIRVGFGSVACLQQNNTYFLKKHFYIYGFLPQSLPLIALVCFIP